MLKRNKTVKNKKYPKIDNFDQNVENDKDNIKCDTKDNKNGIENDIIDNIKEDIKEDIKDDTKEDIKDGIKEDIKKATKNYYCYILRNSYPRDKSRTYNGYTVNPKKRIRQHNQELKGGAIYTKTWGNKTWEIYVLIKGFPDNHNAMQCEWKIKHPARKKLRPAKYNSPAGRVIGLNEILKLEKWTGSSDIEIKDLKLEIWIVEEFAALLDDVRDNIIIHVVDKINLDEV